MDFEFDIESVVAVTEQFTPQRDMQTATAAEVRAYLSDEVQPAVAVIAENLLRLAAQSEQVTATLQASAAGATIQHAIQSGILLSRCLDILDRTEDLDDEDRALVRTAKQHLGYPEAYPEVQPELQTEESET